MAFEEILVISELCPLPDNSEQTKPVGGMCLNIQIAHHQLPSERKDNPNEIIHLCKKVKEFSKSDNTVNERLIWEHKLTQKLLEYDDLLRNEIKQKKNKFIVYVSTQFDIGGKDAGSKITSWVDQKFHTLEEKRSEYIREINSESGEKVTKEKVLYVALEKEKYFVRHKSFDESDEGKMYIDLRNTRDYVGEGANFLLMRYLAISGFTGTFELSTIYINGDMCRNIYESTARFSKTVNEKKIDVCKIFRTIIEECGNIHRCSTILTTHGQIISQEWEGCNYILNINPLTKMDNYSICRKISLRATWQSDLQLFSKYLDYKANAEYQINAYMNDNPEVEQIIADYMQNILLLKPDLVIQFTQDYFKNFVPMNIPTSPHLTKTQSDLLYKRI